MSNVVRAFALLTALAVGSAAAEPLTITDAWIRATPPGARTAAAYLTIANGAAADTLLAASTVSARVVQIHTQVAEGGLQRMVELPELALPAGQTVRLAPGVLHLMLLDITAPLAAGATVTLSLEFAAAGRVQLAVPVVDARTGAPPSHGTH